MVITDQINQRVQRLPAPLQVEVLNFIEFLIQKAEQQDIAPKSAPGASFR